MNNRFFIMLVIATLLAGGATWIAKNWVTNVNKPNQDLVSIVTAMADIPYGAKIADSHVKMSGWPKDHIPKGAFTDKRQVLGKIAQRNFVVDEVLLEPQIKDWAAGSILSSLISEGKRAMSVSVTDVSGVAGFITPGNKVDIITNNNKANHTYILLSNVKVLAIDQQAATNQDKPAVVRTLTLEVNSEDSKKLVKAIQNGSLYFTLRNPTDKQNVAEMPIKEEAIQPSKRKAEKALPIIKPIAIRQHITPSLTVYDWPKSGEKQGATEDIDAKEDIK